MKIRAVFFDFGGVLQRTEFQAPRQHLAEQFGMDYADIDRVVFDSDTARRASVGEIREEEHWAEVLRRLRYPLEKRKAFTDQFFGGDVLDHTLVEYIRALKGRVHTGLISNAWEGLRAHLVSEKIIDVFDTVIISAEVGATKPDERIYRAALENAGVSAAESVFVDDMRVNIEACERIGMKGVWFRDVREGMAEIDRLLKSKKG